jgi:hypothetical protein
MQSRLLEHAAADVPAAEACADGEEHDLVEAHRRANCPLSDQGHARVAVDERRFAYRVGRDLAGRLLSAAFF